MNEILETTFIMNRMTGKLTTTESNTRFI